MSLPWQIPTFVVKISQNKTFKVDISCENIAFCIKNLYKASTFVVIVVEKEDNIVLSLHR